MASDFLGQSMDWSSDAYSDLGVPTDASEICEYCQYLRYLCICPEPTLPSSPPPSYNLSRLPSQQSHLSTNLEVNNTGNDSALRVDAIVPICTLGLNFRLDPPPIAPGYNYQPEARAEEHKQLFSGLPPELDSAGTSPPNNDGALQEIQGEIDRLGTQLSVTPVPPVPSSQSKNAHPIGTDGRPSHGQCGRHGCSVCNKSFCTESKLKRHRRSHNKTYVCRICGATRTWPHHLERHMATHRDGTIPCPVEGCTKKFKTTANIPRHLQNLTYHGLTKKQSRQMMAGYKPVLPQAT